MVESREETETRIENREMTEAKEIGRRAKVRADDRTPGSYHTSRAFRDNRGTTAGNEL
jgi:hypothetical protein